MTDISDEFNAAVANLRQPYLDWLASQGVTGRALYSAGLIGIERVGIEYSLYSPDEGGKPAYVQPVYYDDEIGDLVCWFADRPGRWYLHHGIAGALGEEQIERAAFMREPVKLFRTPLGWLRAGGVGACVLDRSRTRALLRGVRV